MRVQKTTVCERKSSRSLRLSVRIQLPKLTEPLQNSSLKKPSLNQQSRQDEFKSKRGSKKIYTTSDYHADSKDRHDDCLLENFAGWTWIDNRGARENICSSTVVFLNTSVARHQLLMAPRRTFHGKSAFV